MVTVVCEGCQHQGFITAIIQGRAPESNRAPRVPTPELTPAERARFAVATPVATDDLLDLHLFLEAFDGDFAALFGCARRVAPPTLPLTSGDHDQVHPTPRGTARSSGWAYWIPIRREVRSPRSRSIYQFGRDNLAEHAMITR